MGRLAQWSCDILIMIILLQVYSATTTPLVTMHPDQLMTPYFYAQSCPCVYDIVGCIVRDAVEKDPRMGASLLRLHFHDCFVNGCDGSVLLDDTPTMIGEKTAAGNNNSLRGFDVVDAIKAAINEQCGETTVSCADILAVAARDSVVALGGPFYEVVLGRMDSLTAGKDAANANLPSPSLNLPDLIKAFATKGLNANDLVALSGGHTIGLARCSTFRNHIYKDANIEPSFAKELQGVCPLNGDASLHNLDFSTPTRFDNFYYKNLVARKGLLHSDQELFNGGSTDAIVASFSEDSGAFEQAFAASMIKMGNIKPGSGTSGQVRVNCRVINKS